ncbi:MAG: hypothetical protein HXY43_05955 [Fischerella sp.]|nr:hypothetical protein [Fischerella sp.]
MSGDLTGFWAKEDVGLEGLSLSLKILRGAQACVNSNMLIGKAMVKILFQRILFIEFITRFISSTP